MTSKKHRRPAWRPNPQISHARRATLAATAMALGAAVPAYAQERTNPPRPARPCPRSP